MLEIWSNHYLKELYRYQIIFANAPIYYIGVALQRVIYYLFNFSQVAFLVGIATKFDYVFLSNIKLLQVV